MHETSPILLHLHTKNLRALAEDWAAVLVQATFNLSIAHELGRVISDEIRAYGNSNGHRGYQNRPVGVSAWGPNLNIYRDPVCRQF